MPLMKTCQLILSEARRRGWDTRVVAEDNGLIAFTVPGKQEQMLKSSAHPETSYFSQYVADHKDVFQDLASEVGLPVPESYVADSWEVAEKLLETCESIVVKPSDGAHGNGVSVGITDETSFREAVKSAKNYSDRLLIQKQYSGSDFRVLVVGDEAVAATLRRPAHVVGDGTHTVLELIDIENSTNENRAEEYQKTLCYINKEAALAFLGKNAGSVPADGEDVTVLNVPNIGQGGSSIDVTTEMSDYIKEVAVKAAKIIGLRLAGVDFMAESLSETDPSKVALIEINAVPSFGLHEEPEIGAPVPVSALFLDEITR